MTFTLTLSNEQLAVLSQALVKMPFRTVAPLISDIERQLAPQMKPQAVPTPAVPAETKTAA